ncbi:hypothetical protein DMJ13_17280 [halophilic archaeon]|nr:hypothetical protein DMJ13_17280 [halophilic archaeon]
MKENYYKEILLKDRTLGNSVKTISILLGLGILLPIYFQLNSPFFQFIRVSIGLFFLGFFPGYLILQILTSNYGGVRTFIYGVGISLVYNIMLVVVVNYSFQAVGVARPLAPEYLGSATVGGIFILSSFVDRKNLNKNRPLVDLQTIGPDEVKAALFFISLILLAIVAAHLRNIGMVEPMLALLFLLAITPLLISSKAVSQRVTPIAIYCVALAVLYHTTLITGHLWGWDIHVEFHSAKLIQNAGQWSPTASTETIQLLMITLLSTTISNVLGISLVTVFKAIYPILFSVLPVVVYSLSRNQFDSDQIATLAPFLPIFYYGFFKVIPDKQAFGELYLVLLLTALLDTDLPSKHQRIFGILFITGLVLSHYAVSLLSIAFLIGTVVLYTLGKQTKFIAKDHGSYLTSPMIILLLMVLWFVWFTFSAQGVNIERVVMAAFYAILNLITDSSSSRSGAGYASRTFKSVYWIAYMFLAATAVAFTGIGILHTISKFWQKRSPTRAHSYSIFSFVVFAFLCLSIIATFSMGFDRILNIVFVLIAPFAVYGCLYLMKFIIKVLNIISNSNRLTIEDAYSVFGVFLAALFIFSSGAAFAVGGAEVPRYSIALSDNVDWPTYSDSEVTAKNWLDKFRNRDLALAVYNWKKRINSRDGLLISEIEYRHKIEPIYPQYTTVQNDSYFYVSSQPLWHKEGSGFVSPTHTSFYKAAHGNMTKIYASGKAKIYRTQKGNYSSE